MPIWLGGAGRSDEDLARILDKSRATDESARNRRSSERHDLKDANGDLIFGERRYPCKVLEISMGGCSVETKECFRPGVLAPVDIYLPLFGMVLQLSGTTQWMKKETQIGVRFMHASFRSKNQLGALISCITGERSAEEVRETVASPVLNLSTGDVLAIEPVASEPTADAAAAFSKRCGYDPAVHDGEGRVIAQPGEDWPVVFRSPDDRFNLIGALIDLSVGGCTIRTLKAYPGEIEDHVEVEIDMQGLHVQTGGVTAAIYDPEIVGVRFKAMSRRRKEDLEQLIEELCTLNHTRLKTN
jgi:hypothetical protein